MWMGWGGSDSIVRLGDVVDLELDWTAAGVTGENGEEEVEVRMECLVCREGRMGMAVDRACLNCTCTSSSSICSF